MPARLGQVLYWVVCGIAASMLAVTHPVSADEAPMIAPVIEIFVSANGSMKIEGKRYTDFKKLEVKLLEIAQRKPEPELTVRWAKKANRKKAIRRLALVLLFVEESGSKNRFHLETGS